MPLQTVKIGLFLYSAVGDPFYVSMPVACSRQSYRRWRRRQPAALSVNLRTRLLLGFIYSASAGRVAVPALKRQDAPEAARRPDPARMCPLVAGQCRYANATPTPIAIERPYIACTVHASYW